VAKRF